MRLIKQFAFDKDDREDVRREKNAIFVVAGSCCVAGLAWTFLYYLTFGWGLVAALPATFIVIVGIALYLSHLTKNHKIAVYAQIICIIYITTLIQWSIGGVLDSGFVMAWALLGPLIALMFFPVRRSILWFAVYLINVIVTVVFDGFFSGRSIGVAADTRLMFIAMNLSISSLVVFIFALYYVSSARSERKRAEGLLLNVLPPSIADALKKEQRTIAEHYDSASVLFADLVGSTPLFASLHPADAVDWLNEVYSVFDALVRRFEVEKIRTIGDSYMVAAGVPTRRNDHAASLTDLALKMRDALATVSSRQNRRLEFRFGINSGPLVAGVVGTTKFHYDVWGNTVNLASRMESQGEVGRVQISGATYALIRTDFICTRRGTIDVKGAGSMETWFVEGRKSVIR